MTVPFFIFDRDRRLALDRPRVEIPNGICGFPGRTARELTWRAGGARLVIRPLCEALYSFGAALLG